MKTILFTSFAVLLLFAGAGCTSVRSSRNDEAKVVARILARVAPQMLDFKDQAGGQHLVSSLDTSEEFDFGIILDAQKQVFASYFHPGRTSEKEDLLARVTQSASSDQPETLLVDHGVAIAIAQVKEGGGIVGYVAVGKGR